MNHYVPATWRRALARLLDHLFVWMILGPLYLMAPVDQDGWVQLAIPAALAMFVFPAFYEAVALYFFHTTPGKWIFHLRVESTGHKSRSHWAALVAIRSLLCDPGLFISWAVYPSVFFRYDRRHWADLFAETRVVSLRARKAPPLRPYWGVALVFLGIITGWASAVERISLIDVEDGYVYLPDPTSVGFEVMDEDPD